MIRKIVRLELVTWMLGALFLVYAPARAVLPPGAVEDLKATAAELIEARVLKVEYPAGKTGRFDLIYDMEVLSVIRSASGLQVGDTIGVRSYALSAEELAKGYVGPKVPPLLNLGWVGRAYVNEAADQAPGSTRKLYEIAAYGDSFETVESAAPAQDG